MASYLIGGLSRLSVRVSRLLLDGGDEVTVLPYPGEDDLRHLLDPRVRITPLTGDRDRAFREAGIDSAACLLALGEDDLENLRTVVAGTAAAPSIPLVLRAFDPVLAEQIARHGRLRRAFSVSALAAPAFVLAAMGGEVLETMRLSDDEVPIARLQLAPGSALAGTAIRDIEERLGCVVLAESTAGGAWSPIRNADRRIEEGELVAVAGPLMEVLRLGEQAAAPRHVRPAERRAARRAEFRRAVPRPLVISGLLLIAVLFAMVAVFALVLHTGPIHAFYDAVLTAFGNGPLDPSNSKHGGLKVFAILTMIVSAVLVGAVFSFATAAVTEDRLQRREARRIARLHGHAIVAGLGSIGYRVEQALHRIGVPTVAVSKEVDPRFSAAFSARTPLVQGDPRLQENLHRAGIERAGLLFAVTDDELLNVEVCIQGRAIAPHIRTVARVFDEDFAEDASHTLGIDATLSTSGAAATAFASAASDEEAVRPLHLEGLEMAARKLDVTRTIPRSELETWSGTGLRLAAYRRRGEVVRSGTELPDALEPGDSVIVAGSEGAVRRATV